MALVGVEHLGRGGAGELAVGADRPHAADAEQHLLLEPVLGAAAVEPVGDLALGGVVVLDVGVEQQQRHPADLRLPDLGAQRAVAGEADRDPQRRAVGRRAAARAAARAGRSAGSARAASRRRDSDWREVAGPVEQADADDRHAEVAGRLEVVAGEDAETAGVLRQHLGDAELRARSRRSRPGASGAERLVPAVARSGSARGRRAPRPAGARKPSSAASSASRAGLTAPSSCTGSPFTAAQSFGSIDSNRSRDATCQDQRRFMTSVGQRLQRLGQGHSDGESAKGSHPTDLSHPRLRASSGSVNDSDIRRSCATNRTG